MNGKNLRKRDNKQNGLRIKNKKTVGKKEREGEEESEDDKRERRLKKKENARMLVLV